MCVIESLFFSGTRDLNDNDTLLLKKCIIGEFFAKSEVIKKHSLFEQVRIKSCSEPQKSHLVVFPLYSGLLHGSLLLL